MEHFFRWKGNNWNGKDGKTWVNSSLNNVYLDLKFKNKESWIETLCGTFSFGIFGTGKKKSSDSSSLLNLSIYHIPLGNPKAIKIPHHCKPGKRNFAPHKQSWQNSSQKHRSNTKPTQVMCAGKEQPPMLELKAAKALRGHLKAEIHQDDKTSAPIIMPQCSSLPSLCWSQPQLSPLPLMPQQTLFIFTQLPVPQESS